GPQESMAPGDIVPPRDVVLRWRHRDGHIVWIELRAVFDHDAEGRMITVEGSARDVTARHLTGLALAEREAFARAVLDGLGAQTVVIDQHGRITQTNRAWVEVMAALDPAD